MNALTGSTRRRRLVITAVVSGIGALVVSYFFATLDINGTLRTGLVSDVNSYSDLASSVLGGAVPYLDFPFEHLPSMLFPIVGLGWLSDASGISLFVIWPMAMTGLFAMTTLLVDRIDPQRPAGFLFVGVSLPLLPLALFRLEPWVVVFAVAAIVAFLSGRNVAGIGLTIVGTLAKGWPIVVSILPWKSGKRNVAALAAIASAMGLVLVATHEGFRAGRDFDGIHTETAIGSFVLLARHLSGTALDTIGVAGARYVAVPSWAVLVNTIPGLIVLGLVAVILRRPLAKKATVSIIGFAVLGVILVSPLFSTQFLLWLAPFVAALTYRNRLLYIGAAIFAFASVAIFDHASFVWAIEATMSNVMVLALAVGWGLELFNTTKLADPAQDPSTSLKNLPV